MEILKPKHPLNWGAPECFELHKLRDLFTIKAVSFPRVPGQKFCSLAIALEFRLYMQTFQYIYMYVWINENGDKEYDFS